LFQKLRALRDRFRFHGIKQAHNVERAGLSSRNEGQQIKFEIEDNRGKSSAVNLRPKMT
jgi:hypothetical protein